MASLTAIVEEGERQIGDYKTMILPIGDARRLLAVARAALRVQSDLDDCSTAPLTIEAVEALRAAVRGEEEKKGMSEIMTDAEMVKMIREQADEPDTGERNAALALSEQRGAAYDMTWREVESLRERLDKEEEERGRQYGLRVQAEAEVKRLTGLVQHWYEGRARIGAPMTFVDQRFYDAVRGEEEKKG